jgi:hypothetical protein
MSSMIISYQRYSKNNLKNNFLKYKYDQGWDIVDITKDKGLVQIGKGLYLEGQEMSLMEDIDNILSSEVFNEYQYERFRDRVSILNLPTPKNLWYNFYRTNIELFYRKTVTDELIRIDKGSQLRGKISKFEYITNDSNIFYLESSDTNSDESIKEQIVKTKTIKQYGLGMRLLYELLSSTPIFNNGVFNTDILITSDNLSKFSKLSIEYKTFLETQLDISTRRDVVNKPIQQLNNILKLIGLELDKPVTKKVNNKKYYWYKINQDKFDFINVFIIRRNKHISGWNYINETYGFNLSIEDEEWLYPIKFDGSTGDHIPYENPHEWIKPFLGDN